MHVLSPSYRLESWGSKWFIQSVHGSCLVTDPVSHLGSLHIPIPSHPGISPIFLSEGTVTARASQGLRFYSGGWVLRRCVSKTHWVRKLWLHLQVKIANLCVHACDSPLDKNMSKVNWKPQESHNRGKSMMKAHGHLQNMQTDRQTHTHIHTHTV